MWSDPVADTADRSLVRHVPALEASAGARRTRLAAVERNPQPRGTVDRVMDVAKSIMRLTDDELRDVLVRAEQIQSASREGDEWNAELAAVIGAAEEVGLSRRAVE